MERTNWSSDDESDESGYAEFLRFLQDPSPSLRLPKKEKTVTSFEEEPVAVLTSSEEEPVAVLPVRASGTNLTFNMKVLPPPVTTTSSQINHRSTAVMVVDFQNELVKPGGKLHACVSAVMEKNDVMRNVSTLVDTAREIGALVIHTKIVLEAEEQLANHEDCPQLFSNSDGLFTKDTWSCEIADELLDPAGSSSEDVILSRNKMQISLGRLEYILRRKGINTIFLMGLLSDQSIMETASEASLFFPEDEMSTFVISDGCATEDEAVHERVMQRSLPFLGVKVIKCSDAKKMLLNDGKKKTRISVLAPRSETGFHSGVNYLKGSSARPTMTLRQMESVDEKENLMDPLGEIKWSTREVYGGTFNRVSTSLSKLDSSHGTVMSTPNASNQTWEAVLQAGVYRLSSLVSFPDIDTPIPRFAKIPVGRKKWRKVEGDKSGCLHLSAEGAATIVPVEIATTILLGFYGCTLINPNSSELIELHDEHTMQDFRYDKDYFKRYSKDQGGLEVHTFAHVDCPLDTLDKSGMFIIGKWNDDGNALFLTAFRVPQLHSLFVPGGTVHSNDYLCGTWRTMLSWTSQAPIDHVQLKGPDSEKVSLSIEDCECGPILE